MCGEVYGEDVVGAGKPPQRWTAACARAGNLTVGILYAVCESGFVGVTRQRGLEAEREQVVRGKRARPGDSPTIDHLNLLGNMKVFQRCGGCTHVEGWLQHPGSQRPKHPQCNLSPPRGQ